MKEEEEEAKSKQLSSKSLDSKHSLLSVIQSACFRQPLLVFLSIFICLSEGEAQEVKVGLLSYL